MFILELILWCMGSEEARDRLFFQQCAEADDLQMAYFIFSMMVMLLYFALLFDLAVLSTKGSAYVLVCIPIVSEVSLFLLALVAILLAFASGVSVIKHDPEGLCRHSQSSAVLLEITMRIFDGAHYEYYESDSCSSWNQSSGA